MATTVASTDAWIRAQALAREAEGKAKALAEAEAAEEEMAKRASAARTQESEARLVATRKKDEAKEDLSVAQQAERQAVTAVQEAEQLLRAATAKSAVASLAHQKASSTPASGGQAGSGFRAATTPASAEENFHRMTFKDAEPQPVAPPIAAAQPVASQPVGVQPTIGAQQPPSLVSQDHASVTTAQALKVAAQAEAVAAKANLAKAFKMSKVAHRSEASALAHASAPGLDAATKQAATAELAVARSKHAEAATVVQTAKARAAKAYEEVILSEETAEGGASAPASATGTANSLREAEVGSAAHATKTTAATVYKDALATAKEVARQDKLGLKNLHTALTREETAAPTPEAGGREQIASIMPALSSTPFETRHTKVARERVDKALAAATNKEEEVKRVEAWSAALIEAAQKKASEAIRLAKADVMKADDEAATKLVSFVKAKEREAATVAEEALAKQAEAAKMAQEAANARDEANKAAHKAAQWKADAEQAIKSTKEAIKPIKGPGDHVANAQEPTEVALSEKKTRRRRTAATTTVETVTGTKEEPRRVPDATAKPKKAVKAQPRSNKASGAPFRQKKAASLASTEAPTIRPTDVQRAIVARVKEAESRERAAAVSGVPSAMGEAKKLAITQRVMARKTAAASSHENKHSATAAPPLSSGTVEDTPASAETAPAVVLHPGRSGPAGHRVRLAWRAMKDTVMALEDARGVGQPGLEDAYTKQSAALAVLTELFPRMDDLPTVRSPDLHTLLSQSKELGGLILVEEAKTLCGAAWKELREQKSATKDDKMATVERMQKEVHDSLVTAESSARQRVEAAARKIAAGKQAVKYAVEAETRKKAVLAEEKDKAVLGQLRVDVRKKASNAVNLKVRAMQAERVAEADKREMEAATQAARFAQEEAEVESAKALLDQAAAVVFRRREEQRKERSQNHEVDNLAGLAERMTKDAAAYTAGPYASPAAKAAAAKKLATVTAAAASRPAIAATRKAGAGEKRVQRQAPSAGGADAQPATRASGKKAAPGANRPIVQEMLGVATKGAATKQAGTATHQQGLAGKQNVGARRTARLAQKQQLAGLEAAAAAPAQRDTKRLRKRGATQASTAGESARL